MARLPPVGAVDDPFCDRHSGRTWVGGDRRERDRARIVGQVGVSAT